MKTTVIENNKTGEKLSGSAVGNKGGQPKTNGLPISTAFNDKEKEKTEPKKAETVKIAELPKTEAVQAQAPKTDAPKVEHQKATEAVQEKATLNLESTLKLVEELHRRKIQRDRLLDTIDTLDAFEVAQIDDAEETDTNHFQGCVLTIEDDNRRKFTTKNPVIIQAVAQFVNDMCINRLAEIEAGIIIPA